MGIQAWLFSFVASSFLESGLDLMKEAHGYGADEVGA